MPVMRYTEYAMLIRFDVERYLPRIAPEAIGQDPYDVTNWPHIHRILSKLVECRLRSIFGNDVKVVYTGKTASLVGLTMYIKYGTRTKTILELCGTTIDKEMNHKWPGLPIHIDRFLSMDYRQNITQNKTIYRKHTRHITW